MAWASKKQMAIMYERGEKGKDILEKLPDMKQDEFNDAFSELIGGKTKADKEKASATDEAKQKLDNKSEHVKEKFSDDEDGKGINEPTKEAKSDGAKDDVPRFEAKPTPDGKSYEEYKKSVTNPVSKEDFDSIMGFLSPEKK